MGRRGKHARIAPEPERHRDLAFARGLGRKPALLHHLEAGAVKPLRHGIGRKAEPAMGMLVAQEFEIVRREIDHQQPPGGRSTRAASAIARAPSSRKCSTWWMMTTSKEFLRQREVVDVALAHAAMAQARAVEPRPRERQHVEREVEAEAALEPGPNSSSMRPVPVPRSSSERNGAPASAARIASSTASSATWSLRMRSHWAAWRRK